MSNAVKNVMLRVISKRLEGKESLEEIFADYPRLSDADRQEIQDELGVDRQQNKNVTNKNIEKGRQYGRK